MTMNILKNRLTVLLFFCLFASGVGVLPAVAQDNEQPWNSQLGGLFGGDGDDSPEYELSGEFSVEDGTRQGTLAVTLQIKPDWHGYSQKQLDGQSPTKIKVAPSDNFRVTGPFVPNKAPKAKIIEGIGPAEEFSGEVIWAAPIEFAESANIEETIINVQVNGQVCNTSCIPIAGKRSKIAAAFSGYTKSNNKYDSAHGVLTGSIDKTAVGPQESALLTLRAESAKGWHIYKLEKFMSEDTIHQPTIVYFTRNTVLMFRSRSRLRNLCGLSQGLPTPSTNTIAIKIRLIGKSKLLRRKIRFPASMKLPERSFSNSVRMPVATSRRVSISKYR